MKMNILFLIMPLLLTLSLDAKKDKVFAAIRKGNVKEFRHAVRRIKDLKEKDIAELIAYTEDFITYYREKRSILKSGRDFVRTLAGACICVGGLICSRTVFAKKFATSRLNPFKKRLANGLLTAGICGASAYWAYRGLACPYAQSMAAKGQEILKYLQNFHDSDKPAAGTELETTEAQTINESEELDSTDAQSFRSQMPVENAELAVTAAQSFNESDIFVGAPELETIDTQNFRSQMPVVDAELEPTELQNFNASGVSLRDAEFETTDAKLEEN